MITSSDFEKLNSKDPKIKYGFTKELIKTGAESPALLYGLFNHLTPLLKNQNNIIKWTGIDLIGYLSAIDRDKKTDKYIPALIKFLHEGRLITCNHSIFALGLIAKNKPVHKSKIIRELLLITNDTFETSECKNIATGKVLETLKHFIEDIKEDKAVINFIKKATSNRRNSTKKKAGQLLNKIKKSVR